MSEEGAQQVCTQSLGSAGPCACGHQENSERPQGKCLWREENEKRDWGLGFWRQMGTELRTGTGKRPWPCLDHIVSIRAKYQVTTGKSQPCLESRAQSQDHPSRIFGFGVGKGAGLKAEEVGSQETWGQER